jgi:carboxymethylenebutenolidase
VSSSRFFSAPDAPRRSTIEQSIISSGHQIRGEAIETSFTGKESCDMSEYITVRTPDGDYRAYVARPAASSAPAIVVLQEIFGVNADMRETCDELAGKGYIAVCPDLFWRQEPGVDLNHWSEAEWKKGLALYAAFDFDAGVRDILDCVQAARNLDGASGKVGVMGFCLGGLMTFLTAARAPLDAAVVYYGGGTENHLDQAPAVAAPMLMHFGEEDEFISKDALRKIKLAMSGNPGVRIYSYPGCSHAFARHTGTRYDALAAASANGRTDAFFAQHLR